MWVNSETGEYLFAKYGDERPEEKKTPFAIAEERGHDEVKKALILKKVNL